MSSGRSLIIFFVALFCVVGVVPAFAASPGWDVSGASFDVEFTCIVGEDAPYGGTIDIDLMNPFTGSFVGTINDGTYTFPVTGKVSGNNIAFDINFDLWEFTTNASGTFAKDGSISGMAHTEDGSIQYSFESTSGAALSLKDDKDRRGGFLSWGGAFFGKHSPIISRGRGFFGKNGLLFGWHDKGGKGKNDKDNKNDKKDKNDKGGKGGNGH